RAPYTCNVQYRFPALNNQKCPDAANPQFRANLRAALEKAAPTTVDDPWCIGYFIDNEIAWPKTGGGPNAEQYFQICREEVKRVAPDMLYLGSRLADHLWPEFDRSREAINVAAARWCDVVSFNRYRFNPGRLCLPAGFDKPIIIGEFHFGAPDRGPLHHGVYGVGSQSQRAEAYQHYLHECLDNPAIVGAHWYRYVDQCVTGRADGENYQIGLVDICDTPYPETIAAVRQIGYHLYQYRTTPQTAAK
ncbi:MAG TPA: hypothetical protein VE197_12350, partial [Mycobacterium sp.]|nr:hypothetical protein [Mycobacterium sp.]